MAITRLIESGITTRIADIRMKSESRQLKSRELTMNTPVY